VTKNIVNQLKQIIVNDLDINMKLDEIDENASLFEEGLGLDSVTLVEFISFIEKHFSIRFSEDELNLEHFSNLEILAQSIITRKRDRKG
jgi:acyl carrier protein